ncbi:MAG: MarR family transcriptional regulator [Acidobacteria bacterium]|nr:MarR family transcriptional regulator [Acidobacteriota bacterium]MBK8150645.1 MarR family transcriptional regulator [Acidobacteriota bacterium]MBK8811466.1 MarR family transcriptional regulator [Acidobacteriota bacterium]
MDSTDPQIELPVLFAQAASAFRVGIDRLFAPLDLNAGQVALLMILWKTDGGTQADLARELGVSAPTVNKMVQTMVERGFVTSSRSASDGRSVSVLLTEMGRNVEAEVVDRWKEADRLFFGGFTETERLILKQLLSKSRPA